MDNIPPIKPGSFVTAESLPDMTKVWKVGQIVHAKTVTGGNASDKVLLRIGQQLVESRTPVALKAGDQVDLLVKKLGERPLLSILSKTNISQIAANRLKLFISQQADFKSLLALGSKILDHQSISQSVKQHLQSLINSIPSLSQLTNPQQLKSLIQNSSVLLESQLLNQANIPFSHNIKAQLLKLNQQLMLEEPILLNTKNNTPTTLQQYISQYSEGKISVQQLIQLFIAGLPKALQQPLLMSLADSARPLPQSDFSVVMQQFLSIIKQRGDAKQIIDLVRVQLEKLSLLQNLKASIDHVLVKIISQQLIPQTRESDSFYLLIFDLLFKDKKQFHLVELEIEEGRAGSKEQASSWFVKINFEFSELGPIQAKLHIIENQVSTFFRAEKSQTVALIHDHIGLLESALKPAGFSIMKLDIQQQHIDKKPKLPIGVNMLDENA